MTAVIDASPAQREHRAPRANEVKAAVRAQVATMCPNSATYDGNGNVIALVDMATGVQSGTYDYNAFGETTIIDGAAAMLNPQRLRGADAGDVWP